jgi:hypothetical protein
VDPSFKSGLLDALVTAPPGDAKQLAFLGNIQRILDEGQFVAT